MKATETEQGSEAHLKSFEVLKQMEILQNVITHYIILF